MIVFNIDKLEDFLSFLPRRIHDEVYFYVERDKGDLDSPGKDQIDVVLHFIGQIQEHSTALYQTKLNFSQSLTNEKIFEEMKTVFDQTDIKLIVGRITEVFYSISS